MPVHDWTTVSAGTYHDFHVAWIVELRNALNSGVLPDDYYALAEQHAGDFGPDVLALQQHEDDVQPHAAHAEEDEGSAVALADAPPRLSIKLTADADLFYAQKRRTVVIRHVSGNRVVALIEIASPGNKDRRGSVQAFVEKAASTTAAGHHLLIADPLPPRKHDPNGLCSAAFEQMGGQPFSVSADRPVSVAAYRAALSVDCFAETLAIGTNWPDVPLFLNADHYVNTPMEATYQAAFAGVPRHLRKAIEGQ